MRGIDFFTTRLGTMILAVALVCAALTPAGADVPELMNYQGRLTDAEGAPLATTQTVLTFNIYGSAAGGGAIWGPMIFDNAVGNGHGLKVRLVEGRFNVILGPVDTTGRSLSEAFTTGADRYLEIQVESNDPIQPRMKLLSAPYAIQAKRADQTSKVVGNPVEFFIEGNNTPAMKIDGDGNVGIGVTYPITNLHVAGTATLGGFRVLRSFKSYSDTIPASHMWVHIKTPDRERGFIVIGSEEEKTVADSTPAQTEPNADPGPIPIMEYDRYRHFMIEGYAPNTTPNHRVISKRLAYKMDGTLATLYLTHYTGTDLTPNNYRPIAYVGSDNYVYIRFPVYTSAEFGYNLSRLSFVLFALEANTGLPQPGDYEVTITNATEL